jgi:hypothetical protein
MPAKIQLAIVGASIRANWQFAVKNVFFCAEQTQFGIAFNQHYINHLTHFVQKDLF